MALLLTDWPRREGSSDGWSRHLGGCHVLRNRIADACTGWWGKDSWLLPGQDASRPSTIPAHSFVVCSRDGSRIAYSDLEAHDRTISVGEGSNYKTYSLPGALTAAVFSPDGETLYYQTRAINGESALSSLRVRSGEAKTIADHLDASRIAGSIALSSDGRYVYLALASAGAPDDRLRNRRMSIDG